jgi:hypothetical protein
MQTTIEAFLDHGVVSRTVDQGIDEARLIIRELAAAGIELEVIAQRLEDEGIALFAASYEELLRAIDTKRPALSAKVTPPAIEFAHWLLEAQSNGASSRRAADGGGLSARPP